MDTGAELFASVYYLDRAISGLSLFAKSKSTWAELKNRTGSGLIGFRFLFIAHAESSVEETMVCEVPLLPHRHKAKMVPSSAKGKQAKTLFRCIKVAERAGACGRRGQIFPDPIKFDYTPLSGLKIMNERLYLGQEAPTYAAVGKRKKSSDFERQIFQSTALHLAEWTLCSEESDST